MFPGAKVADPFLRSPRLLYGPWQAFERDVARILLVSGFHDVRIVGGTGDHGGDILGIRGNELWVVQCKHTTNSPPPRTAVEEVVEAARFYKATHLMIATSRPASDALLDEKKRFERLGLKIPIADPRALIDWANRLPLYSPSRKDLRQYQEETSSKFRESLLDTGRGQIVLATGLGKTVVMAETVADLMRDGLVVDNRVLVLAHTRELVNQLHTAFWHQLPTCIPTHQLADGEYPTFWDGVTFATVQSVRARLGELPAFGLVLVDEAHHIGADTFQQVLDELRPKMLGGVTATPWRGDGYDIDQLLGPPLVRIGISEGLQKGFLSEVDYRLFADNIDWEFVQSQSRYNYSVGHLNRRLIIPTRDEQAARIIKEVFDAERRRACIVYCPTIDHAEVFAAMMRQYGFAVEAISSENTPRERDLLLSKFRTGALTVVTTVDLFNEGVDVPDVECVNLL